MNGRPKKVTARFIAGDIRKAIRSGKITDEYPSGPETATEYGVSPRTAVAAFELLRSWGLVISEPGGKRRVRKQNPITWVLSTFERGQRRDSTEADDWAAAIIEAGRVPGQHITVSTMPAPENIATWLEIEPQEQVVCRKRLRTVDDIPFQLSTSWFPYTIAADSPLMAEHDVSMPGGILRSIGHPQRDGEDVIFVRMPTPEESEELELPAITPIAEIFRVGRGEDGRPVRLMVTIAPGDRHKFIYEQEF